MEVNEEVRKYLMNMLDECHKSGEIIRKCLIDIIDEHCKNGEDEKNYYYSDKHSQSYETVLSLLHEIGVLKIDEEIKNNHNNNGDFYISKS